MTCSGPLEFGVVAKHPLERLTLEFDFFANLSHYWAANREYQVGDTRRPTVPNGFTHRAQGNGSSGNREPRWNKSEGGLTTDGSLVWESIKATDADAVDQIVAAEASADSGLAIVGSATFEPSVGKIVVDTGIDGVDYQVACKVTTQSGSVIVGVMTVQVRERAQCSV